MCFVLFLLPVIFFFKPTSWFIAAWVALWFPGVCLLLLFFFPWSRLRSHPVSGSPSAIPLLFRFPQETFPPDALGGNVLQAFIFHPSLLPVVISQSLLFCWLAFLFLPSCSVAGRLMVNSTPSQGRANSLYWPQSSFKFLGGKPHPCSCSYGELAPGTHTHRAIGASFP